MSKNKEKIYLIVGEDIDFVKKEVKKIEESYTKSKNADSISFFAEESETNDIIDNCNTYSVFSEILIVKVYDFQHCDLKQLAAYTENPNETTILILISYKSLKDLGKSKAIKTITKNSKTIDVKPLYDNQIIDKVKTHISRLKLKCNNDVIDYIVQKVGKVDSSINKFFELVKEAGISNVLTLEDVKELELLNSEDNIFNFIRYFFEGNTISVVNAYESIISEGTPLLVLNRNIYNKTLQYIKYFSLVEKGISMKDIMKELNIYNQWIFNKIKSEANRFKNKPKLLKSILRGCYEIDKSIKSDPPEVLDTNFKLFITNLK